MPNDNSGLHEAAEALRPSTLDFHRAVRSLMEELEAIDWYGQRIEAASDEDLRGVLAHNRDEEIEHAALMLEWLRRRDAHLDAELRRRLFGSGPVTPAEEKKEEAAPPSDGSLGIGSLRERGAR